MIAELVAAVALAAGPVALLDAPAAQDVAVAGDQVVVARAAHGGRVRVDALAVDGAAVRHLLATRRLGQRWTAQAVIAASSQRVAVITLLEKFVDHGPDVIRWRLYTGPTSGALSLVATGGGANWRAKWLAVDVAVDGDRALVTELRLVGDRSRLRLLAGAAAPRFVRWARDRATTPLAFAGENVAFVHGRRLTVADLRSGTRRVTMKVDLDAAFDLRSDGTVVADTPNGDLVTAAPGSSRTRIPGTSDVFSPVFAGSRVVGIQSAPDTLLRPVVLDPSPRPLGVQTLDIPAIDADERGVAWIANGCVLYAPVDAASSTEPPTGPCPRVEVDVSEYDETLRGRRLRIFVSCYAAPATGCNGTVTLRHHGIAGRSRFHVDPGKDAIVPVTLTRRAARFVRRRVHRHGEAQLGLTWRVRDARRAGRGHGFLVERVR